MVVRSGDVLARIGKMAELFDDHSPLRLMATGIWEQRGFTLLGRLQYKYAQGTWTEWQVLFANGAAGFLSEDNGAYVMCTGLPQQPDIGSPDLFRVGQTVTVSGKTYSVASRETVALLSAQGELPKLPPLGQAFVIVDLRSADGEVLSIDYGGVPPTLCSGRAVALEELKLQGLRDDSTRNESGRQFNCPDCGAQVQPLLAESKSITCRSCNSLIDLSQGLGAELRHALQNEPVRPLIAIGRVGQLQGTSWQVVGFQHRMGQDPQDPDEHFGWDEYLLFNRRRGFSFLVDATDGWSLVKPATGAPLVSSNLRSATYLGTRYELKEAYQAETNYVTGEFYWRVERGQRSSLRDYTSGRSILSMEQTPSELTWSVGSTLESRAVAKAFGLEASQELLHRSDESPGNSVRSLGLVGVVLVILVLVLLLFLLSRCQSCDPAYENCSSSYTPRSSAGSYGGYSGGSNGGGHK